MKPLTCHNTLKTDTPWLGEHTTVCGNMLLTHDHGLTEGRLSTGARALVRAPQGGPWRYCVRCDTNGLGCAACIVELRRTA